jgi:hypothetical protein
MKIINTKFIGISILTLFFIGCNNPFGNKKIGVKCDDPAVVSLAESIINNDLSNKKVSIKIDTDNIVEWDYKDGRYLCKAKINGTYDKNMSFFNKSLLNPYGLYFKKDGKVKGWIFYQTYLTTKEMKKLKSNKGETYDFYVQILNKKEVPVW